MTANGPRARSLFAGNLSASLEPTHPIPSPCPDDFLLETS
jgi:hypothetical protein